MEPLVSVIIPCFNQGEYLTEALNSVLAQTYYNWECVIMDDGSTDRSKQVALAFCNKDKRFHYLYQNNQGLSAARNNGIKNSRGRYILPLDADDLIHKDYLIEAVDVLERKEEIKIVYCRAEFFGEKTGEWMLPKFTMLEILNQNCIFCSAMYRRVDFDQTSGYNTKMKYGLEDWDFWLSMLEKGGDVYQIPQIRFYYRIKKKSMLVDLNHNDEKRLETVLAVIRNHLPFYRKNYTALYNKYVDITNSRWYTLFKLLRRVKRIAN